jgi:hypothetical protein
METAMNPNPIVSGSLHFLVAASLCLLSLGADAAGAAEVSLVTGVAEAAATGQAPRSLGRGDAVNAGEVISTRANSYISLAFADGSRVLLRPNTSFEIEAFDYPAAATAPVTPAAGAPAVAAPAAAPPGATRAFFRLARGGFRAISGLIGKRDRQEYLVRTTVATIGIRGTDYIAELCSGDQCLVPGASLNADFSEALQVGVNEGSIDVTTPRGVYPVEQGQYGVAAKDGQFFLLPGSPMSFMLNPLPSPEACQ